MIAPELLTSQPLLPQRPLPQRLAKFVRDAARMSVAEVRAAWNAGRLTTRTPGCRDAEKLPLDSLVYEDDLVLLDGVVLLDDERLGPPAQPSYAVLHKPRATLSVPCDPRGKGDLSAWLRQMPPGTFAVGRLDRDTTGALLLMTDGDLCNALLRPERHADKLYQLDIAEALSAGDPRLEAMRAGVDVGPYVARVRAVELIAVDGGRSRVSVTLNQGRHRQIRRTCRQLRLPLSALHRRSIGSVTADDLEPGQWRALTAAEVDGLWQAAGGRRRLARDKLRALGARAARARQSGEPDARLEGWLETRIG